MATGAMFVLQPNLYIAVDRFSILGACSRIVNKTTFTSEGLYSPIDDPVSNDLSLTPCFVRISSSG
jgi:hypothetical protein